MDEVVRDTPPKAGKCSIVIAAHEGIQVTDRVRHTVEKRYPGLGWGGFEDWIPGRPPPAFAGVARNDGMSRRIRL